MSQVSSDLTEAGYASLEAAVGREERDLIGMYGGRLFPKLAQASDP